MSTQIGPASFHTTRLPPLARHFPGAAKSKESCRPTVSVGGVAGAVAIRQVSAQQSMAQDERFNFTEHGRRSIADAQAAMINGQPDAAPLVSRNVMHEAFAKGNAARRFVGAEVSLPCLKVAQSATAPGGVAVAMREIHRSSPTIHCSASGDFGSGLAGQVNGPGE